MNRAPEFRTYSEEELFQFLGSGVHGDVHTLAVEELQRRYLKNLQDIGGKQTASLEEVETAIKSLTASSNRLEDLTRKLNSLTIVLVFLTVLAVLTPFVIAAWEVYRPEKEPAPILFQLPPPTAPRMPALPAQSPRQ